MTLKDEAAQAYSDWQELRKENHRLFMEGQKEYFTRLIAEVIGDRQGEYTEHGNTWHFTTEGMTFRRNPNRNLEVRTDELWPAYWDDDLCRQSGEQIWAYVGSLSHLGRILHDAPLATSEEAQS